MAFDYTEFVELANELLDEFGRAITISKLDAMLDDATKPWRGAATPTLVDSVVTVGAFVVPATSIPTESRGMGFDWISKDLLARVREVCIVPASGTDLVGFNVIADGSREALVDWGQCLKPGTLPILYVFGIKI